MTDGTIICHRLDLVVYLQDTVTGELVRTSQVEFIRDGNVQPAVRKETGIYAFLNMGAGDMVMSVRAAGYREQQINTAGETCSQEEPSQAVPILWIPLVPGETYPQKQILHTIAGIRKGVKNICGIACAGWQMRIREFDKKTNVMKLFNPHGRYLYPVDYGIIDQENKTFERFCVKEQRKAEEIITTARLSSDFAVNSPVERVVPGIVNKDHYLLQLDRNVESYLVCWSIGKQIFFRELHIQEDSWKSLDGRGGGS